MLLGAEAGGEEGPQHLLSQLEPDDLGAQAEQVNVVVLDALVGGVVVVAEGSADAGDLVAGNAGPYPGAAHQHPPLGLPSRIWAHTSRAMSGQSTGSSEWVLRSSTSWPQPRKSAPTGPFIRKPAWSPPMTNLLPPSS